MATAEPNMTLPPPPDGDHSPTQPGDLVADELFDAVAADVRAEGARIPRATYRVQFNQGFTFAQARELAGYLHELGVSDLYASPFFKARPASTHGYDIVDHNTLNPEVGGRAQFEQLAAKLRELGLGLLLDIVPNHMGIGNEGNAWWMDVLENGPSSRYATFFDIDWTPLKTELSNKVLLPVLGEHYGQVLESGQLRVVFDRGAFFLRCYETPLPVNPRTYPKILERLVPALIAQLGEEHDAVLELQSILTGLRNLPPRTETQRARVVERGREKEILKRRLCELVEAHPAVAAALEAQVAVFNGTPGEPRSFDLLDELLEEQPYRLSFWRVAAEEINYRRFFDVNDLAAIRMENPEVFDKAHRLLFELLREGHVTALRADHPDGLWDPAGYFHAVQRGYFLERCRRAWLAGVRNSGNVGGDGGDVSTELAESEFERMRPRLTALYDQALEREGAARSPLARPLYLVVEKILSRGEQLPTDWPVHGTSGYEFATSVSALFVDREAERAMTGIYERFIGHRTDFATLVYSKKKLILQSALASELNVLAHNLNRLSERDRHSRDFTLGVLTDALREVIACFPVYRTYVTETSTLLEGVPGAAPPGRGHRPLDPHDRAAIDRAVRLAKRRNPTTDASVYNFLRAILLLQVPASVREEDRHLWREFVMRFQQLTGPVMAKGLEDTTFYIYNRLVSLNEVGGEPERFGADTAVFHRANAERQRHWPHSLLATSTHDTKRSEDVRARISVLSELTGAWESALASYHDATAPLRKELADGSGEAVPDANEEYLFYQTVLGTLPFDLLEDADAAGGGAQPPAALAEYTERLVAYMRKATKEAKVNTSWINADPEYDAAMEAFVRGALAPDSALLARLGPLARTVAFHGMFGALAQTLLRLTSPGVPDTYQGTEAWDLSLVDPDNRRPVDYTARRAMLAEVQQRRREGAPFARELVAAAADGRVKLFVVHTALAARRDHPELFGEAGAYVPLAANGAREQHVVAFARRAASGREVVVAVPRLTARLADGRRVPPMGEVWGDTALVVDAPGRYVDLFTGTEHATVEDATGAAVLPLERLFADFPLALLLRRGDTAGDGGGRA